MNDQRWLVTGAGGRIGSRLRARLKSDEQQATFVSSPSSLSHAEDPVLERLDLTDGEAIRKLVHKYRPAVIIHLAAMTGAACESDPELAVAINVDAVRLLAAVANESGTTRFVLASSAAVYGDQYDMPVDEEGQMVLSSGYAKTKRDAELRLAAIAEQSKSLSAVALRIFNVYGPGMTDSLPNRLVESTPQSPVTLAGMDTFVRDYIHVDDVVAALMLGARVAASSAWSIFNVGTGRPTSNRELVAALEPVHVQGSEPRASYSCADVTRARRLLGFAATRTLNRTSAC